MKFCSVSKKMSLYRLKFIFIYNKLLNFSLLIIKKHLNVLNNLWKPANCQLIKSALTD